MSFSVSAFKSRALTRGGYRPALFEARVTYAGNDFNFLCQATNVPAMTVGMYEVPYFGRKIKVAGDRTFAEWTTTLMEDESFSVRSRLEQWSMDINRGDSNERTLFNEQYKKPAEIILFGKAGSPIRTYTLEGCWPSEVGSIELDWNTTDTIATYTVTWAFDWMNEGS